MSKTKTNTKSTKTKKQKTEVAQTEEVTKEVVEEVVEEAVTKPEKKVRKRLDEHLLVPIASGVQGGLTYISRDGATVLKFENYGDEDVIELRALRTMLSQARKFLQKGWIRVLDEEVIEYLNLERFQKEVVTPDDLEELFDRDPEHIKEVIQNSSSNAKRLIYGAAKEKYINGKLTNIHVIKAIEEALGESLDPNI